MLATYHEHAPGNVYNITNDHPLTQLELFNAIADAVGGQRPTLHLPYLPLYYGGMVAEQIALAHPYQTAGNAAWRHDVWQR